jgi:hypothetical protein
MLKKNKILSFLLVVIIFCFASSANATVYPVYDYAKGMGGTGDDQGRSITTDSSGNVYTVGRFSSTVDFDPGAGTSNLTSSGDLDIFIQKLDSSGDFVWVKQIGSTGTDNEPIIKLDSSGNIYVLGYFMATVDFDPGAGTSNLTSAGAHEIFLLKLDSSGDFVWVKQIGSTGDDYGASLLVNSSNIYITGGFVGTVDFDPGAGTANLTSAGSTDMFVLKLDSIGDYVWAKKMGGGGWGDWIGDIVVDSSNNVYIGGSFGGSVSVTDFDPGAGTANLTPVGNTDGFIVKLDSSGIFQWVNQFGSTDWDGAGPVLDSSGNLYATIGFGNTIDIDPGAGTTTLTSAGGGDIAIVKLNPTTGALIWGKQIGGTGSDWVSGTTFDSNNNLFIKGSFSSTVDFDPGVGTSNLTSSGGTDIFILKLDSSIDFIYVKQFGGTGSDESIGSFYIDSSNGYIYTTGFFNATADFDPSSATANLTSAGGNDIFISRLIPDIVAPTFVTSNSSGLTNTTATITWTTNEASSSIVEYGLTSSYGSTTTEADTGTGVTSHSVNLTGLDGCTTYHYRVKSNDPSANLGTSSDNTFSTSGCAAVPIFILQAMSDAIRAQQNNNTVTPVTTNNTQNTQTNTNTNSNLTPIKFIFTRNLKLGMRDAQVVELQKFLNSHNFLISTTGPGSLNNETNYFGLATKASLIKFQKANDIKPAVGYFGAVTRSLVNELVK